MHMMDSCRIEKAFRHFGHDITSEDHVLEAGLGFAVKTAKPAFIGRDAVLRKKEAGLERRMVQFRLSDPGVMVYHNEPILRDGRIVSHLTSGAYGHHLGAAIGMGYVPCKGESAEALMSSRYEIEIAGRRVAAEASLRPMYDPDRPRVRARRPPRCRPGPSAASHPRSISGQKARLEVEEALNCEPRRAARAGGREARRAARAAPLDEALRPIRAGLPGGQYRPLSEAGMARIHAAALDAL